MRRTRRWGVLACCFVIPFLASPESARAAPPGGPQMERPPAQRPAERPGRLYRIEIEDATEAGLIEQQLKIKPELVRGRHFYYRGDDALNNRLREFGYAPAAADPEEVETRVVRIPRKGTEAALREVGVHVILAERRYWVVRASPQQLRLLRRLGYTVLALGKFELRPRQVNLVVEREADIRDTVARHIDIYSVQRTPKGYLVRGGAYDDAIAALRKLGLTVNIDPDPPGVIR